MDYAAIALFIGVIIYAWRVISDRHSSEKSKLRAEGKKETDEVERRNVEKGTEIHLARTVVPLEIREENELIAIARLAEELEHYMVLTENKGIQAIIAIIKKNSASKDSVKNFPYAAEMIHYCLSENHALDRLKLLLTDPKAISERIIKAIGADIHTLAVAVHRVDDDERVERELHADTGNGAAEMRQEDKLDTQFKDRLAKICNDMRQVEMEIDNIRKKSTDIENLNLEIIKALGDTSGLEAEQKKDLGKLQKDFQRKVADIKEILLSLRVISLDESKVKQLITEAKKTEMAALNA